jgi:lipopolysaccharide export system protein LptA
VRFNDSEWGFFGRLLINQDSIYIYGDSALYNGDDNIAEIFAPIVKVVDGDALLYTYNFRFNTADKVGRHEGGGVLVHDNDIMESVRGYYYVDNHEIVCVESVEMHGADYDMKSDSVIYNTETNNARFFSNSEIWNTDGYYLSANEGDYTHAENLYRVTRDGYILTAEQEIWGDTLTYDRANEHITARRNIQMDDFENKVLAVGDYGEYWKMDGRAILTREPIAISYDTVESDTIFMRADTMWFETRNREEDKRMEIIKAREDSIRAVEEARRKSEEAAAAKAKALEEAAASRRVFPEGKRVQAVSFSFADTNWEARVSEKRITSSITVSSESPGLTKARRSGDSVKRIEATATCP